MKRYQKLLVLVPILILGGCGGSGIDSEARCRTVSTTLKAKDANGPGTTFVQVRPDTVNVKEGCKFTINNPGGETVTITSSSLWLNKGPTSATSIVMGPAVGVAMHKYVVDVEGIGTLDPRAFVFN